MIVYLFYNVLSAITIRSFSVHGISVTSNHHHHHHHHVAIKELGHLLTRSGLTHPEVSSMVFLASFCFWGVIFYQSG
jgi:hypothetical protein